MNNDYLVFFQGVSATGAWVGGLFFLRFWRDSRDPLFGFFGALTVPIAVYAADPDFSGGAVASAPVITRLKLAAGQLAAMLASRPALVEMA